MELFQTLSIELVYVILQYAGELRILHLFSFKTPILLGKKIRKKCKINSRNFTYDGLTFSSSIYIL